MAIFSANVSADGIVTFSLLHHCNTHMFLVIASLVGASNMDVLILSYQCNQQVLTALELIVQKRGGVLANTWTPGDMKEKKFKEGSEGFVWDLCDHFP